MSDKAKIITDEAELLKDGLENLIAQLGTEQDKRSGSKFVNTKRLSADGNQTELNALYRTDWLSGKIVDIIPDDMTREWREFNGDIDPEDIKELTEEEERLDLQGAYNQASKWARLYGTSLIVMNVDDGLSPDQPLIIENIKEGSLKHIKVADRHRFSNDEVTPIADPMNASFGMPEFYRFNETSVKVHHSRVLRFDGVILPYDEFRRNNYNNDSVLDRLYDATTNLNTVTNGSASMVYESNVDIMKVKGLMNYLQTPEGEDLLRKRFTLVGLLKSFNNMLLLDNEEDYDKKSNTFAGLPDLLDRYLQIISAASDIPATRLLGISASGFNATGEGDLKNYYDMIKSKQTTTFKRTLDYFDQIMIKSLGLNNDGDYSYKFTSLFQVTPKEQADIDFVNAQRDAIYWDRDIVTTSMIMKDLQQEDVYTNITKENIAAAEEMEKVEPIEFGKSDIDEDDIESPDDVDEELEENEED